MAAAVVIGGSGLVGSSLCKQLSQTFEYEKIIVIGRTPVLSQERKVHNLHFDFQNWEQLKNQLNIFKIDKVDFFCCLGTTINKAGSREAFFKVDHDYVIDFCKVAFDFNVRRLVIVSAMGANTQSRLFYNKTKGLMEHDVRALNQSKKEIYFLRPSLLLGDRTEKRFAEKIFIKLFPLYKFFLQGSLTKYKPINADQVAKAAVALALQKNLPSHVSNEKKEIIENDLLYVF